MSFSDHSLILKNDGTLWGTGYNIYGQLENKVWWENEHTHNDAGTKKIAHYNAKRNLLVVYYHNNII